MALKRTVISTLTLAILGIAVVLAGVTFRISPRQLLGRVLEGGELLRVQRQSDWDADGDIDFLDFTVFAALYEEV